MEKEIWGMTIVDSKMDNDSGLEQVRKSLWRSICPVEETSSRDHCELRLGERRFL